MDDSGLFVGELDIDATGELGESLSVFCCCPDAGLLVGLAESGRAFVSTFFAESGLLLVFSTAFAESGLPLLSVFCADSGRVLVGESDLRTAESGRRGDTG